ncbi:MAG: TIR domain-containing protein [Chloroflexota bacterium]|nr:TIR domain-containing protein [Chloroflexota bacterium]
MSSTNEPSAAVPAGERLTIFISYRRSDTRGGAGRLYDALRRRFGKDRLFMDVDNLVPGQDWVHAVEDAVARCDVLLALIGDQWLSVTDASGTRRLDDDLDPVRLEIEAALRQGKPVIPVLFDDARMPAAEELPESLRPLRRRHAMRLAHESFRYDLEPLVRALRAIEKAKIRSSTRTPEPSALGDSDSAGSTAEAAAQESVISAPVAEVTGSAPTPPPALDARPPSGRPVPAMPYIHPIPAQPTDEDARGGRRRERRFLPLPAAILAGLAALLLVSAAAYNLVFQAASGTPSPSPSQPGEAGIATPSTAAASPTPSEAAAGTGSATAAPTVSRTPAPPSPLATSGYSAIYPEAGAVDCERQTYQGAEYHGRLRELRAIDSMTVVFEFCSEVDFIYEGMSEFPIHSSDFLAQAVPEGEIHWWPNGTGPYLLEEWTDHLLLEPFADYWGGPVEPDARLDDVPTELVPSRYCVGPEGDVAYLVCSHLYEGMYIWRDGTPSPGLATACVATTNGRTGRTRRCNLREGVSFHNGDAFDAEDVIVSFASYWDTRHPFHVADASAESFTSSALGDLLR